jgi:hypothetical protein
MRKSCYFPDFDAPGWPSPDELKKYFSAGGKLWASRGNDSWALRAEGLYGTAILPRSEAVTVDLRMTGSPDHGVTLDFARWHGRIRRFAPRNDCIVVPAKALGHAHICRQSCEPKTLPHPEERPLGRVSKDRPQSPWAILRDAAQARGSSG